MLVTIGLILIGFVILGVGAELLVAGSSGLALRLGVSPLVVGLTVVAFGTSAPELAVGIESTIAGLSAIALGNVVGSNIANIGLILGITAVIHPITIERELVRKQIPIVIVCSVVMGVLLLDGNLFLVDGLLLVLALIGYLLLSYRQSKAEIRSDQSDLLPTIAANKSRQGHWQTGMIVGGLIMLVLGSRLFVTSAVDLARALQISEALIGLTLVAVGTSIPELATSVTAALRGQSDIAIGNVIGSNIFNILGVLGVTAVVGTIYSDQFSLVDFAVMLLFALALLPLARTGLVLSRSEGLLLLAGYAGYIVYLVTL